MMITLMIVDVNKYHPEWKRLDDDTVSCSECGAIFPGMMILPDFCPDCKSKLMEVEE